MPKDNTDSLSHTRWNCKYHIVFAPKFRRQAVYEDEAYEQMTFKEYIDPFTGGKNA